MPKTAVSTPRLSTVSSKVMGITPANYFVERPAGDVLRVADDVEAYTCMKNPVTAPNTPPTKISQGRIVLAPIASPSPWIGNGEKVSVFL